MFVSLQASRKCSFFPSVIFKLFSALGLYPEEARPGGFTQEVLGKQERGCSLQPVPGRGPTPPSLSAARIRFGFAKGPVFILALRLTQCQGQCQGTPEVS